ncbi:acyltransferase [Thermocoleostomius sinensis]|uniref:Acyltransferase n=1 Tax=Thermocoleostomius sinensis A174 TaxID=2016057 RepID=A0A9E8ZBK2_9CYAN|nr:acyltransferase [Thermocoleostomius sinensis]WAL58388.1 acyltransferase [Thermocoleostomius sinensis A174]
MFTVFPLLIALLPAKFKPFLYRRLLGWQIGSNVHIGLSYINGQHVIIGSNVTIGHFNILTTFRYLKIGSYTFIKNFNHFSGRCDHPKWPGYLEIGEGVNIMNHHYVDSHGKVEIGNNSILAGRDTHIWSHSLSYEQAKPMLSPLEITVGENVYVGARSTLVQCYIPDYSVIGAGSVVTRDFPSEPNCRLLIAGNPACVKKRYPLKTLNRVREPLNKDAFSKDPSITFNDEQNR